MEIRVLRYFLTIAREGSITNAANFLHVTQPTLSRQIHDLEDELGQKLFTRGSHNMTLTTEGMILRKRAEEIISMVDKTEAEFTSMRKPSAETFTSAEEKRMQSSFSQRLQKSFMIFIRISTITCTAAMHRM